MLSWMLHLEKVMQAHRLINMQSSCGGLLRMEIIFFYSVVLHCNSVVLGVCVCVCVCVCCVCVCVVGGGGGCGWVCVSIDADSENQNFIFTDWRGGWVGPRKY